VSLFQATMAVPGRVIPHDPAIEQAVLTGEQVFRDVGCTSCHVEKLPLTNLGWIYTEPNPYNPSGNLQKGQVADVRVNLNGKRLPPPRLRSDHGVTYVPAYTDLKLHKITAGNYPDDPNCEALDMQETPGTPAFTKGNCAFITRKLWGTANEPPFFHHGKYTTLRQAVQAHAGEAQAAADAFRARTADEQDAVIEFLKTLQVLPPGSQTLIVDEKGRPRAWPPR